MNELDEATIRTHAARRAGGPVEQAKVDGLRRSIMGRLDEQPRSLVSLLATAPIGARLGLVATLVVAVSLIAIPIAGGPRTSTPPSAGAATAGSTGASTPDPNSLQVLSLPELQRVAAMGDSQPYRDHIVVADVDVVPDPRPITCLPGDCPLGFIDDADPAISVFEGGDIVRARIGTGVTGPVILRMRGTNHAEFLGDAPLAVGRVAWPLSSFVTAVQNTVRTMEFAPSSFLVGGPYVVDAQLVPGNVFYCALQTPSSSRLAGFACGATAWLAPTEVQDPTTIVDGWSNRPADWVRIQNGAYFEFGGQQTPSGATPRQDAVFGFYLVYPVLKFDPGLCFQCDAGAVAILYAKLEPVPIP